MRALSANSEIRLT